MMRRFKGDLYTVAFCYYIDLATKVIANTNQTIIYRNQSSDNVISDAVALLSDFLAPDLTFLYLNDMDEAGHNNVFGPNSTKYMQTLEELDKKLGLVVDTIRRRDSTKENWMIVVTPDHGGINLEHYDDIPEDRRIFIIVNAETADRSRDFQGGIVDVAPTVMYFLGVREFSGCMDGKVVGLQGAMYSKTSITAGECPLATQSTSSTNGLLSGLAKTMVLILFIVLLANYTKIKNKMNVNRGRC